MERKIKECQTIAELLALKSQNVLNELEERLVFEKKMEIFLRIKEWRLENERLGLVVTALHAHRKALTLTRKTD